jgi:hypothetical protein
MPKRHTLRKGRVMAARVIPVGENTSTFNALDLSSHGVVQVDVVYEGAVLRSDRENPVLLVHWAGEWQRACHEANAR